MRGILSTSLLLLIVGSVHLCFVSHHGQDRENGWLRDEGSELLNLEDDGTLVPCMYDYLVRGNRHCVGVVGGADAETMFSVLLLLKGVVEADEVHPRSRRQEEEE